MAETKKKQLEDIVEDGGEDTKPDLKSTTPGVKIDDGVTVSVKSNVFGRLIYKSGKTGDTVEWRKCGEVQEMSMAELRAMKNTQSGFYRNQCIVITGVAEGQDCKAQPADIYKALGILKYYENLVQPSNFNDICNWKEKEIIEKVSIMTPAARENLIVALNAYIQEGILDSRKKIKSFETVLGCRLTQPE